MKKTIIVGVLLIVGILLFSGCFFTKNKNQISSEGYSSDSSGNISPIKGSHENSAKLLKNMYQDNKQLIHKIKEGLILTGDDITIYYDNGRIFCQIGRASCRERV